MAACNSCREAGDFLTSIRKDGETLTPVEGDILKKLHNECPGKNFCYCQHSVPAV